MANPVNISDAATLIFWCRINLHKSILVLTRVFCFSLRSGQALVYFQFLEDHFWRTKTRTVLLLLCIHLHHLFPLHYSDMYIECIEMYNSGCIYSVVYNNIKYCFNSFMNCYLLLYFVIPLRDSVLFSVSFSLLFFFS